MKKVKSPWSRLLCSRRRNTSSSKDQSFSSNQKQNSLSYIFCYNGHVFFFSFHFLFLPFFFFYMPANMVTERGVSVVCKPLPSEY